MNRINFINNKYNSLSKGLTLVELMVVVSIFLVITGVVIFNYGSFNSNVSLQNLTDDIALSIRKAQGYAIGARGVGEVFYTSYGMHFSTEPNPTGPLDGSNKSFLMFSVPISSVNGKKYIPEGDTCGGTSNCMELFNIMTKDVIKKITVTPSGSSDPVEVPMLDIVFTRPEPRAYFCYRSEITSNCGVSTISRVDIQISNGLIQEEERTKTISIQNTGQISIQATK